MNVTANRQGVVPNTRTKIADILGAISFRQGPGGAIYVVAYGPAKIQKIVPKTVPAGCGVQASAGADAGVDAPAGSGGAAAGAGPGVWGLAALVLGPAAQVLVLGLAALVLAAAGVGRPAGAGRPGGPATAAARARWPEIIPAAAPPRWLRASSSPWPP